MHRALTANVALAAMMLIAPALRGQERILSPTLTSAPFRATRTDLAAVRAGAMPRPVQDDEEGKKKIGRIVTWGLMGALACGAIGYVTAPTGTNCPACEEENREKRMLKGALIGGSIGLTLGVIVTLGGGGPRMTLWSASESPAARRLRF